jgi:hypothetical protein
VKTTVPDSARDVDVGPARASAIVEELEAKVARELDEESADLYSDGVRRRPADGATAYGMAERPD